MALRTLNVEHVSSLRDLWNDNLAQEHLRYISWQEEDAIRLFLIEQPNVVVHSYVWETKDGVLAFVSGTWVEATNKAYLTTLLVHPDHRGKGLGQRLLLELERTMKQAHPRLDTIETVFFNPIQLPLKLHEKMYHPNAPGIPEGSSLAAFLRKMGYHPYATQDVYLRIFDGPTVRTATEQSHWSVAWYDPKRHVGWDDLWLDLNNPHWQQAIDSSMVDHPERPILIVTDGTTVMGFAGPLAVDDRKRGCFAGIGIHSALRGQGLGKALFERLCHSFQDMGAEYMSLFTGTTNPAGRLYRQTGFVAIERFVNLRKPIG